MGIGDVGRREREFESPAFLLNEHLSQEEILFPEAHGVVAASSQSGENGAVFDFPKAPHALGQVGGLGKG